MSCSSSAVCKPESHHNWKGEPHTHMRMHAHIPKKHYSSYKQQINSKILASCKVKCHNGAWSRKKTDGQQY